jgi:hypothetical protein
MVAIVMILTGGLIVTTSTDAACRAFGERLSGAGLMALKLTSKAPLNEGGGCESKPGDVS